MNPWALFANKLEILMEQYPEMKDYTALNMALKNSKIGTNPRYNIITDWDKYRRHNFYNDLKNLCNYFNLI